MNKTYRQPSCREDWQDITKLRFKDADDKIVAVFFIDEIVPAYEKPVIVVWQNSNHLYTSFVNMNGECELAPHRSVVIEMETPRPEPDAKTIMKIAFSDFAVVDTDLPRAIRIRWISEVNVQDENIVLYGRTQERLDFAGVKELLFSRDGETILTYNQVAEELNHD